MDRIFMLTPVPTLVLSNLHTILQVSRGFCDVSGLSPSECIHFKLNELEPRAPLIRSATEYFHKAVSEKRPYRSKATRIGDDTYWLTPGWLLVRENPDSRPESDPI